MSTFNMKLDDLEETLIKIERYLENADNKSKFKVQFIAEELLSNIVRHANFEDRTPYITFNIKINANNSFEIECKDNANAFNPIQKEDPNINAKLEDRELGGLGVFLTKKYVQKLDYIYKDGFNILRINV